MAAVDGAAEFNRNDRLFLPIFPLTAGSLSLAPPRGRMESRPDSRSGLQAPLYSSVTRSIRHAAPTSSVSGTWLVNSA